jgi:hypothetical protein
MQLPQSNSRGIHPGHVRGRIQHRKHAYLSTCAREQTQQHAAAAVQSSWDCPAQRRQHGVPCCVGGARCGCTPAIAYTRGQAAPCTSHPAFMPPHARGSIAFPRLLLLPQDLNMDNTFVRELPADPERSNSLRQVSSRCTAAAAAVCTAGGGFALPCSRRAAVGWPQHAFVYTEVSRSAMLYHKHLCSW